MSHILFNKVKTITNLTFTEKTILFHLADASYDHETASTSVKRLSSYAGCCERTVKRVLRSLERQKLIIPEGPETTGRGWVHRYRFNIDPTVTFVEEEPPTTEELPSMNGRAPGQRRNDLVGLFSKEKQQGGK